MDYFCGGEGRGLIVFNNSPEIIELINNSDNSKRLFELLIWNYGEI